MSWRPALTHTHRQQNNYNTEKLQQFVFRLQLKACFISHTPILMNEDGCLFPVSPYLCCCPPLGPLIPVLTRLILLLGPVLCLRPQSPPCYSDLISLAPASCFFFFLRVLLFCLTAFPLCSPLFILHAHFHMLMNE